MKSYGLVVVQVAHVDQDGPLAQFSCADVLLLVHFVAPPGSLVLDRSACY